MDVVVRALTESWRLLMDSSVYIIFGILVGGLLRMFLSAATVARHLGTGRIWPVLKASLLGVPLPLCSCGVLPAAASLKKQGANNGATAAFLISTPESGVDSIAITYALIDPLMTVARPVAAMVTATAAGITENLLPQKGGKTEVIEPDAQWPEGMRCHLGADDSALRIIFLVLVCYFYLGIWPDEHIFRNEKDPGSEVDRVHAPVDDLPVYPEIEASGNDLRMGKLKDRAI